MVSGKRDKVRVRGVGHGIGGSFHGLALGLRKG